MKEINAELAQMRAERCPPCAKPKPCEKYPGHVVPVQKSQRLAANGDERSAILLSSGAWVELNGTSTDMTAASNGDSSANDSLSNHDVGKPSGTPSDSENDPMASIDDIAPVSVNNIIMHNLTSMPGDSSKSPNPGSTPDNSDSTLTATLEESRCNPDDHDLNKSSSSNPTPSSPSSGTRSDLNTGSSIITVTEESQAKVVEAPPDWFHSTFATFSKENLGVAYMTLLDRYASVEAVFSFSGPRVGLLPKDHPECLSKWIGRGRMRKGNNMPVLDVGDVDRMEKEWSAWWKTMQPDWREELNGGGWERGMYGEDWGCLKVGGLNGWLGIVACLFWWGKAILLHSGNDANVWTEAVTDALWVIKGILVSIKKEDQ